MGEHDDGVDYAKLRSVELALALVQVAGSDSATSEVLIAVSAKIHDFIKTKGENK